MPADPFQPTRRVALGGAGGLVLGGMAMPADPPLAPPDKQPTDLKLPDPPPRPVGWAVVGLGQLALEEVLPAFAHCQRARPVALVSGHPDKARRVAAAYGVDPKHLYDYQSFDRLADNPAVQVVYVILQNTLHAEFTIRGLKAGKHVLCEKPMAPTVAECERMIAAAAEARRQLMIAYRLRYEPVNQAAIDLCRKGALGKLKSITASNGQFTKAPNIRLSRELGGGPVGDVGIYCLNAARYLTGEEPVEVTAVAHQPKDDLRFREVAETVSFTLRFPSGVPASCDCSFGMAETRRCRAVGTEGWLDLDPAFAYRGLRLTVGTKDGREQKQLPEVNHFAAEMDHFSACVTDGKPCRTPGQEGLADVRVIAAISEAARIGRAVRL